MARALQFFEAIREAIEQSMAADPSVYIMGLGVPDPKAIFGTTRGLQATYGPGRVMDMPCSEHAMTGVAIGSALVGMRPILNHQRLDFALLSIEPLVNQAAKWHYMFGGHLQVPLVIRLIVGRGWGQGPQHSQSLHGWFAHVPGLKVVMPATPYDAKGLMVASIEDNNPVIFIESRWLYHTVGEVPEPRYRVPLGRARVARKGQDLTIVAVSWLVIEALRAAEHLADVGVDAEVIDLQTLRPLDAEAILGSVRATRRLLVADSGWKTGGFGAEIVALVSEEAGDCLARPPKRVALSDCPVPTTSALSRLCYPHAGDLVRAAASLLDVDPAPLEEREELMTAPADVPHSGFTGPF